jgi:cobalt-zinc-cadmium resistance protein CzcA
LKGKAWDIEKTNVDFEYGRFNSYNVDNGFTVSQTFAFPTVYANQYKLAKASVKQSELALNATQSEIINQVKAYWWQLSFYYSKLSLLNYQDSLYDGFLKAATRRAEIGETNKLEQISAESQSLEVKNFIRQTNADIEIYKSKLRTLLNIKQNFDIADTVLIKLTLAGVSDSAALLGNPSLAMYNQQAEIARMELKVEKAKVLPDLKVGYFSQSIIGNQEVNGELRTFSASDRFTGMQAGIAIPLWIFSHSSVIKASKINHRIAQTEAEYAKTALSGEFEGLMQEYNKYKSSIDYYEKQALPQTELIINQSTKSYKAGAMDYLEYIQSLSRALAIKSNYLDALNQYNQSIIALEYLMGKVK